MTNADGFVVPKPEAQWNEEDEKKYSYDYKARNMLIAALGVDEDWLPKVTAIKEANDLRTLDMMTLFGKLQEHEQELMNIEKHEKNQKKEKDKNIKRKSIALKASTYKSSTNDVCESESSDDDKDSNEDMGLFVRSTLHNEAKEAFKRLTSNKKIFNHLEKKISDSKKELETLKKSMVEATKGKKEDDKGFWFRWGGYIEDGDDDDDDEDEEFEEEKENNEVHSQPMEHDHQVTDHGDWLGPIPGQHLSNNQGWGEWQHIGWTNNRSSYMPTPSSPSENSEVMEMLRTMQIQQQNFATLQDERFAALQEQSQSQGDNFASFASIQEERYVELRSQI
ncbi:uncharacterized protein LOC127130047 [Lathyrus oleraceus]|uniref:uncharacterized protein LOC127130047 n=1 Tax=Pisum sativum TaxID=3888 RepID=UPI0021CF121C|nr:uncharacterized protein LOC127130047 [Pisum sativum]